MKTKEFKNIISQSTAKANGLILNTIERSCIPFNSWIETHSRLKFTSAENQLITTIDSQLCFITYP